MKNKSGINSARKRRIAGLYVAFILFGAVLLWSYFGSGGNPEKNKNSEYDKLKEAMLSVQPEKADESKRKEIAEVFEKLPQETKEKLFVEVVRQKIAEFRKATTGKTEVEKRQNIDRLVADMGKGFSATGVSRREDMRKLDPAEEKRRLKKSLDFYYSELTSEERRLLEPVVEEVYRRINLN